MACEAGGPGGGGFELKFFWFFFTKKEQVFVFQGVGMTDEEREEFLYLLSSGLGRRYLWRQMVSLGVFSSSFRDGQPDARLPVFEAQRNIGLWLFHQARQADAQLFNTMMLEGFNQWTKQQQ